MAERPKRKAGVFDPWRQTRPAPPKPQYDLEHPMIPVEDDQEPTATVSIKGHRYGVHVKVYGRLPTPYEEASAVLYAALSEVLRSPGTRKFFAERGLFDQEQPGSMQLSQGVHIDAREQVRPEDVTERIAIALKDLMAAAKDAKPFLARKGISVYLIT